MAKYVLYILLIFVSWEGLAQNTSNLSGSFDIGPVGNATYNIPVDLPPGTAGLKPDISIVYNSFSGDGVMGRVFHCLLYLLLRVPIQLFFIMVISVI